MEPGVLRSLEKYRVINENGECVIQTDEDDESVNVRTTNHIENSNDIVIGPVTHFNCPVTIIQNGSSSNKLVSIEPCRKSRCLGKINEVQRRIYIGAVSLVLTILLTAIVLVCTLGKADELFVATTTNWSMVEDVEMIPRKMWGARRPLAVRVLEHPTKYVIIAHTAGASCSTLAECAPILQTLQTIAVETGSPDIGYNFLVGGDGNVYEARGWDAINYLQSHSIAIAYMGNFSFDKFSDKMQRALKVLLERGLQLAKLDTEYILLSHNQTTSTLSPGTRIYEVISKWPHFYPKNYLDIPD